MNLDPALISNFLLAVTIYVGTMAAKASSQSRAMKKVIRKLRAENEALWEERYAYRKALARAGLKYPQGHPLIIKIELEGDANDEEG